MSGFWVITLLMGTVMNAALRIGGTSFAISLAASAALVCVMGGLAYIERAIREERRNG